MFDRSIAGLNWLNFLVALQSGSGAFLAVYLTAHSWNQTQIGFVLSLATITAMVCQVPAGAMVDAARSKQQVAGLGIVVLALSCLLIGIWPSFGPVVAGQVLLGASSTVLAPAIAAITLSLSRNDKLGERLGKNVRFSAIGASASAALLGATGFWISHRAVFLISAAFALPALLALRTIESDDMANAHKRTDHVAVLPLPVRKERLSSKRDVLLNPQLLIFAAALGLFQLCNAAVLPLASHSVARTSGHVADLVVAGAVIVPQALAVLLSPRIGRAAQEWGRRPLLIAGFMVLPIRVLLFYFDPDPYHMVVYQALDGISASVIGVMVPLVIADITRKGGRFNLAMGVVGLAVGLGAAASNLVGGALADDLGNMSTFGVLAGAGVVATLVIGLLMPETRGLAARARPALHPA